MKLPLKTKRILGEPSYVLATRTVELAITRRGGHMAPVRFFRDSAAPFAPYRVAPWWRERRTREAPEIPGVLRPLRGDFFCMPFGGNALPWRGEAHPPHGETAESEWTLEEAAREGGRAWLRMSLAPRARPGRVTKTLQLIEGGNTIYCAHRLEGFQGPMCLGHHPTLAFPDEEGAGLVGVAPFTRGQVYPGAFENPEARGYSILKPGARFASLDRVERADGAWADLTRYPARRGYEDLVMLCADPQLFPAWSAVTFPRLGALWFSLKDPRALASTVLWHDNGGRHYPPWNGRSVNTLGVEEVTAYFHEGLAPSARANLVNREGAPTALRLSARRPAEIRLIQGAARIPRGFGRAREIRPEGEWRILIVDDNRRAITIPVFWPFLKTGELPQGKGLNL